MSKFDLKILKAMINDLPDDFEVVGSKYKTGFSEINHIEIDVKNKRIIIRI